jgi:hypothetical protein
MPVAQFPGDRNWGYDGVYPYAVQNSYGGPAGFKRLVSACHRQGLAVILDVVYNHLGPEGNYLREYGFYFTDRYRTPWGEAINFDGPHSDEVRRFFITNALYWVTEFHVDALRLDAVHAILDFSAQPFLQELAGTLKRLADSLGRPIHLIAESALNDTRLLRRPNAAARAGCPVERRPAMPCTACFAASARLVLRLRPSTAVKACGRVCLRRSVFRFAEAPRQLQRDIPHRRRLRAEPRPGGQSPQGNA